MSSPEVSGRALAKRVSKLLLEKGRAEEAVCILAAWAASGPNDREGQELLAEALRIDPGSELAKGAFMRMEGLPAEQPALDRAIRDYALETLARLEAEHRRPVFHRAQVGFNNNLKYQGAVYHVQTEDSGIDRPHIITHLFADGGRVIKSHKRSYASEVKRPDIAAYVRGLMKAQHLEMCVLLREGRFDAIIAGKAAGGLSVLTELPDVKVRRGAGEAIASSGPPSRPMPASGAAARAAKVHARLVVLRSLWGGPEAYEISAEEAILGGKKGDVRLEGERFCAPHEAVISRREGHLWLADLEGGNGVFVRIRQPVELVFGDEFLVGDQLLRLETNPIPDDEPDDGPTYFYSSPQWQSSFRVVQIWQGGLPAAVRLARGTIVQIGRTNGDLVFSHDPLVSEPHCILEEQAGAIVLTDLDSRAGTFVRITGERELADRDELAIGRTRLRVELPT